MPRWRLTLARARLAAVFSIYLSTNALMQSRDERGVQSAAGGLIAVLVPSSSNGWECGHITFVRAWKDPQEGWFVEPTSTSKFQNEVLINSDCQTIRRGVWTPWLVCQTTRLRMIELGTELRQISVDSDDYWSIFVKLREKYPFFSRGVWADHTDTRGRTKYSVRWLGLANDVSVLAAFIGLWFTRVGVIRRWREIRRGRFKFQRLIPGVCRSCGYDRRGLPAASPCPECGDTRAPARM